MKRLLTKSPVALPLLPVSGREGGRMPDERDIAFRGVTLVEVLMSLMIMSIGISSVAVLFPISVLRSIQATQLTNAAILKTNAETLLQMRPELVFDPDGDGNLNEHVGRTEELHYVVDPGGYFEMATGATFSTFAYSTFPTLSNANDATLPNDSTLRGGADWFGNVDSNIDGVPEPFPFLPRYDGGVRTATIPAGVGNGFRPQGPEPEEARALRSLGATLSKLGDAWDTQYEGFPEEFVLANGTTRFPGDPATTFGAAIVGVKFPVGTDLSAIPTATSMVPRIAATQIISDPEICRAVIFSADGNFSVALPLIAVNAGTPPIVPNCVWTEDVNFNGGLDAGEDLNLNLTGDARTLPPQFINPATGFFEIGRVLLQSSRTHDYNWLLTVRRGRDGSARGVDVVITHNKGITPDDERLYTASFDPRTDAVNSPFQIEVFKDGGLAATGEIAEPALKKSGYILDVQNARWYRVRDYVEQNVTIYNTAGAQTQSGYLISLETPVIESSPTVFTDSGPSFRPYFAGQVMFLPGVIDVYPMGSISTPGNL